MSKPKSETLATVPASPSDLHVARFKIMHRAAGARGMEFKMLAYFAGYELVCLRDAYKAEHGETRGRKKTGGEEENSHERILPLTDFIRTRAGCSTATAYRYMEHYEGIATAKPDIAAKLNAHYEKTVAGATLPDATGGAVQSLATLEACKLSAQALRELMENPDAWGLEGLFEEPEEEEQDAGGDDDNGDGGSVRIPAHVKFFKEWHARVKGGEFLRLPKPQMRQARAAAEKLAQDLKDALEGKAPAEAKPKRKA